MAPSHAGDNPPLLGSTGRAVIDDQSHRYALPAARNVEREALARLKEPRILLGIGLAIVAFIGLVMVKHAFFDAKAPPAEVLPADAFRPTPAQLAQLKLAPAQVGANAEIIRASGSIQADADHSTPILLPYSGQILAVMAEPGQHVTAGQPLLQVASPELVDARNTLLTATAQVATAVEAERIAEGNQKRQKSIYETAGGALKDYLQSQADLVTAQSNLRTAQSALRAAQDRLGLFGKSTAETNALEGSGKTVAGKASTLYRSPVSGLVTDRSVAPGQFVSAGGSAALLTITDPAHVWLVAQLPESEAAAIRVGDHVSVTTPALPGRTFSATIDNIAAGLDPATHRLPVRATIANADGALKPQMFASFVIMRPLSGGAGVLVPAAAIIHEGDTARVWVMARDGLLHGRPVSAGETEGGFTRITNGLSAGDRVVTSGALFVNEAGLNQ